jgi:hypothetical protein
VITPLYHEGFRGEEAECGVVTHVARHEAERGDEGQGTEGSVAQD